jgi:hypothetical protein
MHNKTNLIFCFTHFLSTVFFPVSFSFIFLPFLKMSLFFIRHNLSLFHNKTIFIPNQNHLKLTHKIAGLPLNFQSQLLFSFVLCFPTAGQYWLCHSIFRQIKSSWTHRDKKRFIKKKTQQVKQTQTSRGLILFQMIPSTDCNHSRYA